MRKVQFQVNAISDSIDSLTITVHRVVFPAPSVLLKKAIVFTRPCGQKHWPIIQHCIESNFTHYCNTHLSRDQRRVDFLDLPAIILIESTERLDGLLRSYRRVALLDQPSLASHHSVLKTIGANICCALPPFSIENLIPSAHPTVDPTRPTNSVLRIPACLSTCPGLTRRRTNHARFRLSGCPFRHRR